MKNLTWKLIKDGYPFQNRANTLNNWLQICDFKKRLKGKFLQQYPTDFSYFTRRTIDRHCDSIDSIVRSFNNI